jgi:uncharacterized membrane protein
MDTTADTARRLGILLGVIIALLAAFSGYEQHAFDSYVHMFFSDHYQHRWFNLWEPRWYGGFSVVAYPPLSHQMMALASWVTGSHERAFVLVTFAVMAAMPLAVAAAARAFVDDATASLALLLTALWPTAHRFAYLYGQLPTLMATVLALFAMAALHRYLTNHEPRTLFLFVALVGATAGTHHVSLIFLAFGSTMIAARHILAAPRELPRALLAGGTAALAVALVVWPFLLFSQNQPQVEIPHISRDPLFSRPVNAEWCELVAVCLLAPLALLWALWKRDRALISLGAGTVILAILATGGTTALPRWLFGRQWRWLTYDKFHLWATLLTLVLLAFLLRALLRFRETPWALAIVMLPATLLTASHKQATFLEPEFISDLSPLLSVVRGPEAARYRHLTLGFGDQFCRLDIYGDSPSIDGDYHTARNDPALRTSGIGTLDAAKYYPTGHDVLAGVLARADALSLRWVFVYDAWYYPLLFDAGFSLKEVWPSGVSLFEKADVPKAALDERRGSLVPAIGWGVLPVLSLCAALALAWVERRALARRSRRATPPTTSTRAVVRAPS